MEKGLVSVIVPNYNAEAYLKNFIEDMLRQTYKNWELILVDDNSTDSSKKIISEYSAKDSRIKLLERTDDNKGACQRRNQGLRASIGEFIIFFDSDDSIPEDTLTSRVNELNRYPEMDFVVTPAISFNEKPFDLSRLALGIPLFKDDLSMFLKRFRLPFAVWTNTYRRSFLERTGIVWDEKLTSLQDSDFNIRCISAGAKYKYSDSQEPGYFWRVSGNAGSITKSIKSRKNLDSQLYFYRKLESAFKGSRYEKDVERFGLTLLNRFALLQYDGIPYELLRKPGRTLKFKILRRIYSSGILSKLWPLINLIFSPIAIGEEYLFQIKNRAICKRYIKSFYKDC